MTADPSAADAVEPALAFSFKDGSAVKERRRVAAGGFRVRVASLSKADSSWPKAPLRAKLGLPHNSPDTERTDGSS